MAIELDEVTYRGTCAKTKADLQLKIEEYVANTGRVCRLEFRVYKMGSAFLRDT